MPMGKDSTSSGGMKLANKFSARKEKLPDGKEFDSQHEYERFCMLRLLERAGKIQNLQRQVKYELIPTQWKAYERYSQKTGKRLKDGRLCLEKACTYTADFVYTEGGQTVVEDAKGVRTEAYRIKKKLMLYIHGIRIKET